MTFSARHDLMISWPEADARALPLLSELGLRALFVPYAPGATVEGFLKACRDANVIAIAELTSPAQWEAARSAGFAGVAYAAPADETEMRQLAQAAKDLLQFVYLKPDQIAWDVAPAHAVLVEGQWPGLKPQDPGTASATGQPWIDSNAFPYGYLRGKFPKRPALLGFRPNEAAGVSKDRLLPFYSVEIALTEAAVSAGNVILSLPEQYRRALVSGEPKAIQAWKSLAQANRFLRKHSIRFEGPPGLRVAVIAGTLDQSGEILNMLYRYAVSPSVLPAGALPVLDVKRSPIIAAANVPLAEHERKKVLAFVEAGGTLLAAPAEGESPWWSRQGWKATLEDEARSVFPVGRGKLIGYKEVIIDPYEFAIDVLEETGWSSRDLRLWNADRLVGLLHRQPNGDVSVELINYGSPRSRDHDSDILIRVEGAWRAAVRESPEQEAPVELKVRSRKGGAEIEMQEILRFATILVKRAKQ